MSKRERVISKFEGRTIAQQNAEKETNINTIVSRYRKTGVLTSGLTGGRQPMWVDLTSVDYQDMLNLVSDIDQQFATLPARTRGRFRNDPYQLVRFVEDPQNREEAVRLGLLVPTPEEAARLRRRVAPGLEQQDLVEQAEEAEEAAETPEDVEEAAQPPKAARASRRPQKR